MSVKRVVVVEGEDAAPEAIRPSLALVDRLGVDIEWIHPPVGQRAIEQSGSAFPPEAQLAIDDSDATLFGATSGKSAGALFYLRWGKQTYANVRPSRFRPGFKSPLAEPEQVDFVIVRENLEDLYLFLEGEVEDLAPLGLVSPTARRAVAEMGPGRYGLKVITEAGTERVCRFAFELARARRGQGRPGRVTSGTKHNMLPRSDGLFRDVAERVAAEYPEIEFRSLIIDDLAHHLVATPEDFDVVVSSVAASPWRAMSEIPSSLQRVNTSSNARYQDSNNTWRTIASPKCPLGCSTSSRFLYSCSGLRKAKSSSLRPAPSHSPA